MFESKGSVPSAKNADESRDERKLVVDEVKFTATDGAFGRVLEYKGTL